MTQELYPVFRIGMTASEVIVKIVEINPEIISLLFKVYTPSKNLDEESVNRIRFSIERMLRHTPSELEESICLRRGEITLQRLNQIVGTLAEKRALAVTSSVKCLNTEDIFHIPMMDFNCKISTENLGKIQEFLKRIRQKGAILVSGRSYHYYGNKLLSERELLVFFGKCLLFADCIDFRYIGHRFIAGYASLRISKEIRRSTIPKVASIL